MTLKEFRKTIYDGLKELGLELNEKHLGFLSDKIQEYSKFHNEVLLREYNACVKEKIKKKKENKQPIKTKSEKPHQPTGLYDMPKFR